MQYIGPNLFLAPDMVRNDGKFDVIRVGEKHRDKLQEHIKDWQEGKLWPPEFGAGRGRRLKLKWTGYPVHIDDKLWPAERKAKPTRPETIEIKVASGAVKFLVPEEVHRTQTQITRSTEKGRERENTRRNKLRRRRQP